MTTLHRLFRRPLAVAGFAMLSAFCASAPAQEFEELGSTRLIIRSLRDLGPLGQDVLSLCWSADGRKLLVDKHNGTHSSIQVLDLEQNRAQEISSSPDFRGQNLGPGHCSNPSWNPSEEMLV